MSLYLHPISLRQANKFVGEEHRHHPPTRGHKFSVSVRDESGVLHGVAIAGRPVNRVLDDGAHLEVLRVCTDGTPNACSMLYGAMRRAGVAMGYKPEDIVTYTLASEPGVSLHAAGWVRDGVVRGRSWSTPSRPREDRSPLEDKIRWHA